MSKVDTSNLSPKQKMQYKTLWRKLHGGEGGSSGGEESSFNWVVLVPIGALIVYWVINSQNAPAAPGQTLGGPPTPIKPFSPEASGAPLSSEAREARLRRFAESDKPKSEENS